MLYFVFGTEVASAQLDNLADVGAATGLGNEDPRIIIARIIRIALGFVGVIGVILVMYGGFLWMTSKGDPTKIEKAKQILINAGIGTVIILSALAITQFVLSSLLAATGYGESTGFDGDAEIITAFSQALGNGNLDSHYPPRNAVDIPRNTNIAIAFKIPVYPGSFMDGYSGDPTAILPVDTDAIKVYETSLGDSSALTNVNVAITANLQSIVLDPQVFLGNSETNTNYTVEITDTLLLDDDGSPGVAAIGAGYIWTFNVSTEIDVTPPQILSVVPFPDSTNPRNILVQINYSEAMNPVFASGFYPDPSASPNFTKIKVVDNAVLGPADPIVEGEWKLVNQFSSSEFVTSEACGINSCGETIYCLPENAALTATALAATLGPEPPASILLADGLVDMSGNSLDGSGDGIATGPLTDSYTWDFATTSEIMLVEPSIVSVNPSFLQGNPAADVAFDQPISVTFDQLMSLATMNSTNAILKSPTQQLWFTFSSAMMSITDPHPLPLIPAGPINVTETTILHGIFTADRVYGGEMTSGLRSIYQNCYTPSKSVTCTGAGGNCCADIAHGTLCEYPLYSIPGPLPPA